MENIEKKVIRVSKKKLFIWIVVIVILGIISLGLFLSRPHGEVNLTTGSINDTTSPLGSENSKMMYPDYYPQQNNTPNVTDTREFLKTNYNAEIQTRNVKNTLREVKGAIKVANGRIDSLNENPKNSYVSFVVPKVNFESFKEEIESITHEKLITENISSENLLSQKQSIEQQQQSANNSLLGLQQQQKDLTAKHNQTKNKLQSELTSLENQLSTIPTIIELNGFDKYATLRQELFNEMTQKNQQLASENSTFNTNNQNLKNQIASVNTQIAGIKQQDTNFTDNIETVSGSVRVQWISLWKLTRIFSPVSPVIIIIILVIGLWYFLKRKNYLPEVEFI